MTMRCKVCSNTNRLKIDRAIVAGQTYVSISKTYGVPDLSVMKHAKNHLSRQLLKSQETKNLLHSRNLFENVQGLIDKTNSILDRADSEDKHFISLAAVRELRQIYEFLIKFSVYMKEAQDADDQKERDSKIRDLKRLSVEELILLEQLISKMEGDGNEDLFMDTNGDSNGNVRSNRIFSRNAPVVKDEPEKSVVYRKKKLKKKPQVV